jgi:hypothetical protein
VEFFSFPVEPGSFDDRRIIRSRKSSASGEKGPGEERGVRKCKHGFKLQFSSSVDIKTWGDYDLTSKNVVSKVI